ncbi:MAG: RiPP maturation radical SAM C-methyltransferase [Thermodesulfobacteriota bacterium]|nr:RiPP maturation radical SAM C-methyltransferase [Thermodesulfobacteriota bacterium]
MKNYFQVALVSMPWPLFNRPSVQLGSLKAYLEKHDDSLRVNTFHPYLETAKLIGTETYHWISQNVWVCEALYSSILFPEQRDECCRIVDQAQRKSRPKIRLDFNQVRQFLKDQLERWVESIDWSQYQLAGFSVCLNQLLASLTAAQFVKQKHPDLPVLFGGSSCFPDFAEPLFRHFSVDFMISGEGEQPLLDLCRYLAGQSTETGANIFSSFQPVSVNQQTNHQVTSLSHLPIPDYDDYFREKEKLFAKNPFIPVLPVEFSRGCWWGKCNFCNLNLQWHGYRSKSPERMVIEVISLSEKYGCLDLSFTDNVLPVKEADDFFSRMAGLDRDIRFFGEIRANQRDTFMSVARQGGLTSVQAGIEALSDSLLKKMAKGTTVIDNLAVMKSAVANRIELDGNLIIEFPESSPEEVEETLGNLDFALPFRPLTTASFFLGHGSPVDLQPRHFGILAKLHHPQNKKLFPEKILKDLVLLIKEYRGDRSVQRRRWAPVARKVKKWREFHRHGKSLFENPLLSYRDGGDFIVIRQELPGQRVLHHRLRGLSRKIYLACEEICKIENLSGQFPTISEAALGNFLDDLVQKKVMFCQDEKCLALAVQQR